MAHTALNVVFVLHHTKIGKRMTKKLGIYSQWRCELFLIIIFVYRERRYECSAPLELAQRTSRWCEVFFSPPLAIAFMIAN
jgi:hypothetical protein